MVTRADRLGNRGKPAPRPVAEAARELRLPVLMPAKIGAPKWSGALSTSSRIAWSSPRTVRSSRSHCSIPSLGAVNVHASLLPRWRGASPIAHAILAGDAETGVSIMRMEAGLDTGPVYAMARIPIEDDATTPALTAALADLGASELVAVLSALKHGSAEATPQPKEGVAVAPRLTREDGRVAWATRSAVDVDRMVRALQPWPGVVAPIDGVDVQIQSGAAVSIDAGAVPGSVARHEGESVVIATLDGGYRVDLITPPGKRVIHRRVAS